MVGQFAERLDEALITHSEKGAKLGDGLRLAGFGQRLDDAGAENVGWRRVRMEIGGVRVVMRDKFEMRMTAIEMDEFDANRAEGGR